MHEEQEEHDAQGRQGDDSQRNVFLRGLICMPSFPFFHKIMGFAGACQPLRGTGDDAFLPHILFKEPVPEERETEKGCVRGSMW